MAEAAVCLALVAAALAAPHALALERAAPGLAAAVWLAALALRATLVTGGALLLLAAVPSTGSFEAVSQATLHRPLPGVDWHLDMPGDPLAHAAVVLPALALAVSLLLFALTRLLAAARLRALVDRRSLGPGPGGSLVLAEERVLAGVSGIGPARVLLSHAALAALDREELDATVAHELGHLRRHHRSLRLLGATLACLGRCVPGTTTAARRFAFSVERDADEYAVKTTGAPLALASAICKSAASGPPLRGALGVGGAETAARVEHLLAGGRLGRSPASDRAALALAVSVAGVNLAVLADLALLLAPRPSAVLLAIACGG